MSYRLTILGCGSSGGVPRIGNDWGQSEEPPTALRGADRATRA